MDVRIEGDRVEVIEGGAVVWRGTIGEPKGI